MIRISNDVYSFFLVKTITGMTFVVELKEDDKSNTMTDLCKAIVEIEQSGHVVSGVYRLTESSSGQRVSYRSSKAYKEAKKEFAANKEK